MKVEKTIEIDICDICNREDADLEKCSFCGKEFCWYCGNEFRSNGNGEHASKNLTLNLCKECRITNFNQEFKNGDWDNLVRKSEVQG